MESDGNFPLIGADAIALSNELPETIDLMFCMIVETPGFPQGLLYPAVAWRHELHDNIWFINLLDGFTHIPHIIERLKSKEPDSQRTGDSGDMLAYGMMNKNDFTWDSIVRASNMSEFWKDHINWAIQECFAQATVVYWNEYPSLVDDNTRIATHIITGMNSQEREAIAEKFSNYMFVYSSSNHHSAAAHKSPKKLEESQRVLRVTRENLMEELGITPDWGKELISKDDNGVEFFPKPHIVV